MGNPSHNYGASPAVWDHTIGCSLIVVVVLVVIRFYKTLRLYQYATDRTDIVTIVKCISAVCLVNIRLMLSR